MGGITDPAEEYFKDGIWGWDGTQWRKLGLLFGYRATVGENVSNLDAGEGENCLTSTPVPQGEVWVIQDIAGVNVNTSCARIAMYVCRSNREYPLLDQTSCSVYIWVIWTGNIVLSEGDCLKIRFFGCTAGDDIHLRYLGYKVSLT